MIKYTIRDSNSVKGNAINSAKRTADDILLNKSILFIYFKPYEGFELSRNFGVTSYFLNSYLCIPLCLQNQ
jgi:hypothetical protein